MQESWLALSPSLFNDESAELVVLLGSHYCFSCFGVNRRRLTFNLMGLYLHQVKTI